MLLNCPVLGSMPFSPVRMKVPLKALLLCAIVLCGFAFWTLAQTDIPGTIRSQTDETLVPVLVLDKSRALKFHHMQPDYWRNEVVASGYKMWENIAVANLRKEDFRLYEDGYEIKIQSVTPENENSEQYLATNSGRYWQAAGVGGGAWSTPDWLPVANGVTSSFANSERIYQPSFDSPNGPLYGGGKGDPLDVGGLDAPPMLVNLPPLPWYMIAYTRPILPPGSCHSITVKVDRADSLIYSRNEYCDASDSAPDAIADTKLGIRIRADLLSKKKSALPLRITAIPVFTTTGARLIRLFVDAKLDAMSIGCDSFMDGIGIVGLVYSKGGTIAQRFSDGLFYAPGENSLYWDSAWFTPGAWPGRTACSDVFYEPTRYDTQLSLPAGAYQLKIGVWNGHVFGRAELPLTVDDYDPTKLAIGGLALVRTFGKPGSNRKALPRSLADQFPPLVAKGTEVTPTEDTRMQKGDLSYFYLQLYEPQDTDTQQATVMLHLQIRDVKTGRIVEQPEPLNAGPFTTLGSPVIPIVSGIDITNLAEGSYELQAQATDSTGGTTAWQSASFTVEK
jgi:hypothetical protein